MLTSGSHICLEIMDDALKLETQCSRASFHIHNHKQNANSRVRNYDGMATPLISQDKLISIIKNPISAIKGVCISREHLQQ